MAKPFLKWAGGKKNHVPIILEMLGKRTFRTYVEPFVGGGAMFFGLAEHGVFERAVISDLNEELISCYQMVRAAPGDVHTEILYWANPWTEKRYYFVRDVRMLASFPSAARAARTIFLNKAGFNGLYRLNRSGGFNVPWGKRKKAPDWDVDNLCDCSRVLDRFVLLRSADFDETLFGGVNTVSMGKRDLVYLDPPYVPSSETRDFTNYTGNGFGMDEQERLAGAVEKIARRGTAVILSQSDTPWVRERFRSFSIKEISVRHNISASGKSRTKVGELLIHANL